MTSKRIDTEGPALVDIRGVEKRFGDNLVLKGIDMQIHPGEVVVIIGPSGSGKSTLLRTLNQLERIDGGEIRLDGELIGFEVAGTKLRRRSETDLLRQRRQFGMVFQQFNLFPNKTAIGNIMHGPVHVKGIGKEEAKARALKLLEDVGLQDRADFYPSQLSGGQQQRVAIARALAMDPRVMLFDEPTSALDPELVGDVLEVMKAVSRTGQTMVVVTHEMGFAREIADRVVFMEDGAVVVAGSPDELMVNTENPRLRAFLSRMDHV